MKAMLPFVKMEGCGNDYVYLDGWSVSHLALDLPSLARRMSARRTGVGSDGLIVIGPTSLLAAPAPAAADACMRMFNADGSEGEMCGNGIRCAAKLAWDHGRLPPGLTAPRILTRAGVLAVTLRFAPGAGGAGAACVGASVSMGPPRLRAAEVPVAEGALLPPLLPSQQSGLQRGGSPPSTAIAASAAPASAAPLPLLRLERSGHEFTCIGMGNPHAVCFLGSGGGGGGGGDSGDSARSADAACSPTPAAAAAALGRLEAFPLESVGRAVETDAAAFPRATNVEFVVRLGDEDVAVGAGVGGGGGGGGDAGAAATESSGAASPAVASDKGAEGRGGASRLLRLPVLRQRTWERGSGATAACGTGACAVAVAAILTGRISGREAIVRLDGGDLRIRWPAEEGAEVTMIGPARTVFTGEWELCDSDLMAPSA